MVHKPSALERRILLKHIGGFSDADLIIDPDPALSCEQKLEFESSLARLRGGEPVSKIIGVREFYSLEFEVNADVLDPRPDSETLVDAVLQAVKGRDTVKLLELGCGSGCLSVAIAHNHAGVSVDMIDISTDALSVAKRNISRHGLDDRIRCFQSDWYETVVDRYDVVISNPPYIESKTIESLAVAVKKYDPILALDGGSDGLDPYHIIFSQAKNALYPQGQLFVEHGADQHGELMRLMECHGFAMIRCFKDLSGTNRVLSGSLCMNQIP